MRKRIKITESQLNNVIKRSIEEDDDLKRYPMFIEHWENKFEKSVQILLKIGKTPEELINKINVIIEKSKL